MTMKIVRHGVVMIKLNSNLVNIFDIFNVSISGINRNANTLIRYFLKIPRHYKILIYCKALVLSVQIV